MFLKCNVCGYERNVPSHEHGYDNMDEVELVLNYFYDLVDYDLHKNPNRVYDEYCVRYDLRCGTCGMEYSVHYDHKFEDGACIYSGYCDLVEPVNNIMLDDGLDDENRLESNKEKVYTLTK